MDIIQGLIETESIGRPMWRIVNNNGTFEILNNMSSNVIFSILNGGNIEVDTDVYNVITNYTEGNGGTSSQWTTSGVEIYYNSGNIGIGTNDPMTPLHIYNTSNTRLLLDTTTTSSASIEFRRGIGTDILTDFRFINDTNGYIKLQYENNTQTYSDTIANLAWFSSNETIIHKNTAINGRVGIGTTYHATRSLDVFGDANISGLMTTSNLSVSGSATITNSVSNTSLTIQNSLIPTPTITSSPSAAISIAGIYSYMVFTYTTETGGGGSGQTLYTAQAAGIICDILVVGGGGSGGNDRGGGGGGGGVIYQQNITLNGSYTIRVGKGGLGPTSGTGGGTGTRGINGINTSISGTNITTITTIGGGGGGSCNSGSIRDGLSGGSGGGGSQYNGYGSGGTGTAGQGRNGGTGFEPGAGGGGGGAVNVGVNATSTNAGNGGVGLSNTITGSTVIYGSGGGGGGTSPLNFGGTIKLPGTGGSSGAGNGGGVNANGTNATVYGGGGGGGGVANGATTKGGDGASGVVIIRYTSSSSSINFVRGTTTDANHDYKIGNYNGEFKVISSVSSVDTDYIKITSSGAISNPTGTASWNTGSDRRIKENIERASYDKCYDNINRLELNRFSYIEGFNTVNKDNKQLGFIAQEVYEVFPKSISSQGYYSDTLNIPDLLSIDVSQINYTLYGAVKKLIEINNEKDTCLKKLNNELKTIETILNIVEPPTSNMVVDDTTSNMVVDATTSNIVVDATTSNMVVDATTSNMVVDATTSNMVVDA